MVGYKINSLCQQAEFYYYDFLFDENRKAVPIPILDHIDRCLICNEKINQLKDMILQTADKPDTYDKQLYAAKSILLELYFSYVGKRITCQTVKPFLPTLLEQALEIKVPTPITVHLDNCLQCSEDLETIRNLSLNTKQLRRLSRFFAETSLPLKIDCSKLQDAVSAASSMDFDKVNEDELKHISFCPECSNGVYRLRDSAIKELLTNKSGQEQFCSQDMTVADIFDFVIPYGLDFSKDQYAKFRQPVILHFKQCSVCMSKMQNLHNLIYNVALRNESEIVTTYHIEKQAQTNSESEELYNGYPIRVEVEKYPKIFESDKQNTTVNLEPASKKRGLSETIKPFFKVAAAAAILIAAIAFLFNISSAKAVSVEQICKAIGRAKNVHISTYSNEIDRLVSEVWVSRSLKVYMVKTGKQTVLSDISKGIRKIKQNDTGMTETSSLAQEFAVNIELALNGFLGLVPFDELKNIPAGAQWHREVEEGQDAAQEKIEIYDLLWARKTYGGPDIFYKWRVFVNPETKLPIKTELYQKEASEGPYRLSSTTIIENLTEDQIKAVFDSLSS